jgi:hypothetical protein
VKGVIEQDGIWRLIFSGKTENHDLNAGRSVTCSVLR